VCFLTQSVQLTLSSVQLTLLECVDILIYFRPCSLKMNRFALLNFKNFMGEMPPDPHTGQGLRHPSLDPTPPRHSGASRLRVSPSAPPSSLSVCIVDILRYFRPCCIAVLQLSAHASPHPHAT